MSRIQNVVAVHCLLLILGAPARAATIRGRAIDGESSSRGIVEALRAGRRFDPALKVPLAESEITVDLISLDGGTGTPSKSWTAATDSSGDFVVDTGNDIIPPGSPLVARAAARDSQLFSAYFFPGEAPVEVHLFPTTESMASLTADLTAVYDVERQEGKEHAIRVRVRVHVLNRGNDMYVGRKGASGPWREIWRIPLPPEATITLNSGPFPGLNGWSLSADKAWAILDTPIPGVSDFEHQGPWDLHYRLPARQRLIQTYPVALPMEPQRVSFWCVPKDMALECVKLKDTAAKEDDPLTGEKRPYENVFSSAPVPVGERLTVLLTVDNVAVGQMVAEGSLLGGGLRPRRRDLDPPRPLPRLAGETARSDPGGAERRGSPRPHCGPGPAPRPRGDPGTGLSEPPGSPRRPRGRRAVGPGGSGGPILPGPPGRRTGDTPEDRRDRPGQGYPGPALAVERAHLLEALARALPREGKGG